MLASASIPPPGGIVLSEAVLQFTVNSSTMKGGLYGPNDEMREQKMSAHVSRTQRGVSRRASFLHRVRQGNCDTEGSGGRRAEVPIHEHRAGASASSAIDRGDIKNPPFDGSRVGRISLLHGGVLSFFFVLVHELLKERCGHYPYDTGFVIE